jgi:tRNA(adenine34) deaminase
MWSDLALPWQLAFSQAWKAYCAGSYPIGAVLLDEHGKVLTTGRNHVNDADGEAGEITFNQFAHAESNALIKAAKIDKEILHRSVLYTTLEPCPMCMGIFYMSGVRELHYAARDPYAGSAGLIGTSWYLSLKPIKPFAPEDAGLEDISIAMNVQNMLANYPEAHRISIFERWREIHPRGIELGEKWFHLGFLTKMANRHLPFAEVFDQLQ